MAAHPLLSAQAAQVRQAESNLGAERLAWVPEVSVKVFHTRDVDLKATGGGLELSPALMEPERGRSG